MADAINKSVRVPANVNRTFALWIQHIDEWWPRDHSRSKDAGTTIVMEGEAGGRFFERTPDGTEHDFGRVVTYDPPHRLAYHWFLGSDDRHPTLVTIVFTEQGDHTHINVTHAEHEMGPRWDNTRQGFTRSWDAVLPAFAGQFNQGEQQ